MPTSKLSVLRLGMQSWLNEAKKHGTQLSGPERLAAVLGAAVSICVYPTVLLVITMHPTVYLEGNIIGQLDGLTSIVFFPAFTAVLLWRAFG